MIAEGKENGNCKGKWFDSGMATDQWDALGKAFLGVWETRCKYHRIVGQTERGLDFGLRTWCSTVYNGSIAYYRHHYMGTDKCNLLVQTTHTLAVSFLSSIWVFVLC